MEDIQFDKADYGGSGMGNCANCNKPIGETYWHANGLNVCGDCAELLKNSNQPIPSRALLKGAAYALGAAICCSFVYAAIVIATNYDLALIAIAVGWLVGRATRIGTAGFGGRKVQIIAVAATYISICGTLYFQALYSLRSEGKGDVGIFGHLIMAVLSMGKPFLELGDGFGGIIGLAILFFGLQQAWNMTKAFPVEVAGPYPATPTPVTNGTE